jgi:hypothetical protein
VVGLTVLVRNHAHQLVAFHLGAERTAHAAIGTGGDHTAFRLTQLDHGFFHQGRGRAGLHTGAARHAFRVEEIFATGGGHAGFETTPGDGQCKGALGFFAGTHAAVADDALARVVVEVGVGSVFLVGQMVVTFIAVTHFPQADLAGHGLQLAVAVGGAGQAVQRVIGDVKLHDIAAQGSRASASGCARSCLQ